jgi:hypothetical protein
MLIPAALKLLHIIRNKLAYSRATFALSCGEINSKPVWSFRRRGLEGRSCEC